MKTTPCMSRIPDQQWDLWNIIAISHALQLGLKLATMHFPGRIGSCEYYEAETRISRSPFIFVFAVEDDLKILVVV